VDGFRVSYRLGELLTEDPADCRIIVPPKALNEINRLLQSEEDFAVDVHYTDRHALFALPHCALVTRLIEGEFIKYRQVFTEDHATVVTVNRHAFLMSLERVSVIASKEAKKNPIVLRIEADRLEVSSQTESGNVRDEIPVEADGGDMEISFNPRYLLEAVRAMDDEMIAMQFNSPLNPCVLRGLEDPTGKYLVLPLRLRS